MMCNPHHPPDLEVFRIIRSLKDQWYNITLPDGSQVYRIVGIDAPSHNREAYDSMIDIPVGAFETRNLSGTDTLRITDSAITIEPAFEEDLIHMGATTIEIAAEGFTLRKAVFYSHTTPVVFSGASAEDATVVNVTSKHSPMAVSTAWYYSRTICTAWYYNINRRAANLGIPRPYYINVARPNNITKLFTLSTGCIPGVCY